jgi:hypothetical protein
MEIKIDDEWKKFNRDEFIKFCNDYYKAHDISIMEYYIPKNAENNNSSHYVISKENLEKKQSGKNYWTTKNFYTKYFEITIDYYNMTAEIEELKTNNTSILFFKRVFIGENATDGVHGWSMLFTHANNYYTFIETEIMHFQHNEKIVKFVADRQYSIISSYAVDEKNRAILFDAYAIMDYAPNVYAKFDHICNLTKSQPEKYGKMRFENYKNKKDGIEFIVNIYPTPKAYFDQLQKIDQTGKIEIQYNKKWVTLTRRKYTQICHEVFAANRIERLQYTNTIPILQN